MNMRKSKVLEALRQGRPAFSVKINTADARIVDMAARCGIECIWTDTEHVANDWSVIEKHIYAAKASDADVLVRVARGSYSDYIRPLELDAAGIMVPHVMSAEDARAVARMTRFYPVGRRPVDGGNADGAFAMMEQAAYNRAANENRFVVVQIEDPEPLEQLDEIAQVEGIDMLFFGPGDFSHSIGVSGDLAHPQVQRARRMVAEAARRHGKYAGTVGGVANAAELLAMGYSFLNLGADVVPMIQYFKEIGDFARKYRS